MVTLINDLGSNIFNCFFLLKVSSIFKLGREKLFKGIELSRCGIIDDKLIKNFSTFNVSNEEESILLDNFKESVFSFFIF